MNTFLTPDEILQLVTTGVCVLTEDLMVRMSESYEDSDWYNDPNNGKSLLQNGIVTVQMKQSKMRRMLAEII